MAEIGELHQVSGELEIEWRIKNFSSLYKSGKICYSSYETSAFYFAGTSWKVTLSPKDIDWTEKTVGGIKLGLMRLSFGSPVMLEYSFGIKMVEGERQTLRTHTTLFPEYPFEHTFPHFLLRSTLEDHKSKLLPSDILTLTCSLKIKEPKDITKSCLTRVLHVVDNLKNILKHGRKPDLMIKLSGGNLHVHRMILEDRSPVFADMFSCGQPPEVEVEDIDFTAMDAILLYMYTGDIVELTTENVFSIFTAADKFDVEEVKQMCLDYIRRNLSDEWMCDVILFSERQKAGKMSHFAKEYFSEYAAKIIKTNHWKSFLSENRDIGEELLSYAVEKLSLKSPSD